MANSGSLGRHGLGEVNSRVQKVSGTMRKQCKAQNGLEMRPLGENRAIPEPYRHAHKDTCMHTSFYQHINIQINHILGGVCPAFFETCQIKIQLPRDFFASLSEHALEDHSGPPSATACGRTFFPWVGATQPGRKLHGCGNESRLNPANRCESTVMMGSLPWRPLHQANTLAMSV